MSSILFCSGCCMLLCGYALICFTYTFASHIAVYIMASCCVARSLRSFPRRTPRYFAGILNPRLCATISRGDLASYMIYMPHTCYTMSQNKSYNKTSHYMLHLRRICSHHALTEPTKPKQMKPYEAAYVSVALH